MLEWLDPWEFSPTLIVALLLLLTCYWRGSRTTAAPPVEEWLFVISVVLIYLVAQTHLEYFSEHEFFMHRLQHLVLHHIAPFLMVLSHPGARLRDGLPPPIRRMASLLAATTLGRLLRQLWRNPVLASIGFVGVVLLWLTPAVHLIAMLDWRWYRVMNWSVFVTGLMFWNLSLARPDSASAPSLGVRMAMLILVIPPQVILGALMFFSSHSLYPVYSLCGRAFTHLSELGDQQIGALILWIPGSMMSVIAAVLVMRSNLAARTIRG